jgi:hypothetical protein
MKFIIFIFIYVANICLAQGNCGREVASAVSTIKQRTSGQDQNCVLWLTDRVAYERLKKTKGAEPCPNGAGFKKLVNFLLSSGMPILKQACDNKQSCPNGCGSKSDLQNILRYKGAQGLIEKANDLNPEQKSELAPRTLPKAQEQGAVSA